MNSDAATVDRERRWAVEAAFFDAQAESRLAGLTPVDPRVLARYSGRLRRQNPEEFRFSLLGDLRGRRVLDIGCGAGQNSVLLAKLGGTVTGIDISGKAIELAQRRAQVNGVSERCRFLCSPMETADIEQGSFDIVWGDAILHHLIAELDAILPRVVAAAKPGGLIVFAEPISLAPWVRKLRLTVPVATDATPDERPLEQSELDVLRRYLPDLHVEPFRMLGRLDRFVLPDFQYERAVAWRRLALDGLGALDRLLFQVPRVRRLASTAVLWARRPMAD